MLSEHTVASHVVGLPEFHSSVCRMGVSPLSVLTHDVCSVGVCRCACSFPCSLRLERADGQKCARCWKYHAAVTPLSIVCPRCQTIVEGLNIDLNAE